MVMVKPIRSEEDYEGALARLGEIFQAENDTLEGDERDVLADLIEVYEDKHHPIGLPSAVAAIEFQMDQMGLTPRDLIPYIGSRSRVSEVLSGKRNITMSMARALRAHLNIPAEILLQEPGAKFDIAFDKLEPSRFPLKEMAKFGWIPDLPDMKDRAEELVSEFIERSGGQNAALVPLYRKNDHRRVNAKSDRYALAAWCLQVVATANRRGIRHDYEPGCVTQTFLRQIAQLSVFDDGPVRAKSILAERGIGLECVQRLSRTYLDGAALRMADGRPVIGLTLRYDRIDNFWFTLLHELAHVGLHLDGDAHNSFIDDLTLRGADNSGEDSEETQADSWAEEALIPMEAWEGSEARLNPNANSVILLAQKVGVHPAIVAGRVRYERGNYRLLSQFVGSGQVRKQFDNN